MEGLIFRPLQQPPRICLLPPDLSGWLRNQKCSHNHMVPNHICSHKLLIKLEIHCVLRKYCSTLLAVVTTCIEHWYTMETWSHDGDTAPVVSRGNCLTARHVLWVKSLVLRDRISRSPCILSILEGTARLKRGGAHIDVFGRVGTEYGWRPLSITMPPPPWMTDGFSQSFTLSYSLTIVKVDTWIE